MQPQFQLVHVYCNKFVILFTGSVALCQWRKSQLKNDPAYKPGLLQVRRKDAVNFKLVI
jgi:hypothetical protein